MKLDKQEKKIFLMGVFQVMLLALLFVGMNGSYYIHAIYNLPNETLIEWLQSLALLITIVIFVLMYRKLEDDRSGLALIAGFFGSMFFREQDVYLNTETFPGWEICALFVLAAVFYIVYRRGIGEAVHGLAKFVSSGAFPLMAAGIAMLLVYSRLYGSGYLWSNIIIDTNDEMHELLHKAKRMSEESTELLGYVLMMLSAFFYRYLRREDIKKLKSNKKNP
ncbi:MAG: hypothetical protein J5934_05745 [Succinivibrio sp.]|nr:hypothetical protein [Succinivibrio sp.]